jgi:putative flippase GtrA
MKKSRAGLSISLKRKLILNEKVIGVQFIKFSLVGALNTGIHYLVFILLFRITGLNYLIASTIGYSCGLINSFFFNKLWTFRTSAANNFGEFLRFSLVNVVALLVNLGSLKYCVSVSGMRPEYAQLVSIGFSLGVNFLGNKFWTFRNCERPLD